MSFQQQDDPFWVFLAVLVLLITVGAVSVLFWKISPAFRLFCLTLYMAIKVVSAAITFDFGAAKSLAEALKTVVSTAFTYGAKSVDHKLLWQFIRDVEPSPLRIALFGLIPLGILVAREVKKSKLSISEQGLIKEWQEKTIADVCKEWNLNVAAFKDDPLNVAKAFLRERKKRNIPPNIIARKIEDEKVREAILRFARLVEKGEVLEPISDPEEIRRRTIESLRETAK